MDPTATTFVYRHTRLGILTEHPAELIDLTEGLDSLLTDVALKTGFLNIRSLDAGTGIMVTARAASSPPPLAVGGGACLPIVDGHLQLGAAERVFLVDLEGPGARQIAVVLVGEGGR
jgi:thiamine phosphate synthase YjbQ (UPF0047 family)